MNYRWNFGNQQIGVDQEAQNALTRLIKNLQPHMVLRVEELYHRTEDVITLQDVGVLSIEHYNYTDYLVYIHPELVFAGYKDIFKYNRINAALCATYIFGTDEFLPQFTKTGTYKKFMHQSQYELEQRMITVQSKLCIDERTVEARSKISPKEAFNLLEKGLSYSTASIIPYD